MTRADGGVDKVAATLRNGRWFADTELRAGDKAVVAPGGVRDAHGEINGSPLVLKG